MLLDSCCCDLPVIWVTLVTQPMCLNLPRLLIVSVPKDHHTQQIYSTFYHWVILCTELHSATFKTALHFTKIGLLSEPLQSGVNESPHWLDPAPCHNDFTELQWFHRVTMISPSHTLSIFGEAHLQGDQLDHLQSHPHSVKDFILVQFWANIWIIPHQLHIWSMANILSSGRQHKLKGEHWRATQIEGWSQTLGI